MDTWRTQVIWAWCKVQRHRDVRVCGYGDCVFTQKFFCFPGDIEHKNALKLSPTFDPDSAKVNPLRNVRITMENFLRNYTKRAVGAGCSLSMPCTVLGARCRKKYMKSNPGRSGIRFYALADWETGYLICLWDTGSSNKTGIPQAVAYETVSASSVIPSKASLTTQSLPMVALPPSGKYRWRTPQRSPTGQWTPHCDGKSLYAALFRPSATSDHGKWGLFTWDGPAQQCRGCKQTGTKGSCEKTWERPTRGLETVSSEPQFHRECSRTRRQRQCSRRRQSLMEGNCDVSPVGPTRVGYLVWKDGSTVVFYTNALADTPTKPVMAPCDHAWHCARARARLRRWMGTESMHAKIVKVLTIVLGSNLFMNGVDRLDKLRAVQSMERKERRVTMPIFTLLLDASVINAYALYETLLGGGAKQMMSLRKFKRQIAKELLRT